MKKIDKLYTKLSAVDDKKVQDGLADIRRGAEKVNHYLEGKRLLASNIEAGHDSVLRLLNNVDKQYFESKDEEVRKVIADYLTEKPIARKKDKWSDRFIKFIMWGAKSYLRYGEMRGKF